MRVLVIVLVSFLCSTLSLKDEEVLNEWRRFQIFKNNLDHIQAHNDLFRKGETTFTKGINKFADWTEDEFMQYVGRGLSKEPTVRSGKTFEKTKGFKSPESVDWRKEGAVTPVKNQGDCGACYAFSATGTMEGQFRIKTNLSVSLSEQNLVDCDIWNMSCLGGWPTFSIEYAHEEGIETEEVYPYTGEESYCKADSSKTFHVAGYQRIPEGDEEALQEAVSTEGPVSICLFATTNFQLYKEGILMIQPVLRVI